MGMNETFIIVAHVTNNGYDRTDLENIEGNTYGTKADVEKDLMRINPMAENNIMFVPLYEFVTDWNNTDDDENYLEENYAPHETFISYVTIKYS